MVNKKQYTRAGRLLMIVVPLLLVAAIYSNTLEVPFLFDDEVAIVDQPAIRIRDFSADSLTRIFSISRPVAFLSYAVNFYFHQFNVSGYHIFNIAVHLLTGFFLFLFIRSTLTLPSLVNRYRYPDLIAYGAVLLWLVHPLHTSSVTYIVQRMTSMATLFVVLSCLLYTRARLAGYKGRRNLYFAGSFFCWLLALGCKQIAVPLPFFILLYEWYFFQALSWRWLRRHLLFVLAPFLVFIVLAFVLLGSNPWLSFLKGFEAWPFTPWQRFLTEFRVVVHYVTLLLYPHPGRLNLDYDFPLSYSLTEPLTTLFSMIAVGLLVAGGVWLARRQPLISFCIWWFLGSLLLELIWPTSIIMEYKTYLPSVLFFLPVSILIFQAAGNRVAATGIVVLLLVPLSLWTYERNRVWHDGVSLWADVVSKSPQLARGYVNLGKSLGLEGRYGEAERILLKAMELDSQNCIVYFNLGRVYERQNRLSEALAALDKAELFTTRKIQLAKIHNTRSLVYRKMRDYPAALAEVRKALYFAPELLDAQLTRGVTLELMGRHQEAAAVFQQVHDNGLDSVDLYNNWGITCHSLGQVDRAITMFKRALVIDPEHRESHYNLGIAYSELGMFDKAREEMRFGM
jgi:tetratricopeptide (TPR) repeat protein